MPYHIPAKPFNMCGRIHIGPVCVNGGRNGQPICEWCGCDVTRADRDEVQRRWDTVSAMLRPMKEAMAARDKKR